MRYFDQTNLTPGRITALILCAATAMLVAGTSAANDAPAAGSVEAKPVQARWNPTEVKYSYMGFTTAYDCMAFESKMKTILRTLGAHPQTKVLATGCAINRVSRNFFVTITTAMPVPETQADTSPQDKSRQELLDRLGVQSLTNEEFPAAWKRMDLSEDRRLNLQPGDCELMDGLRREVLPKLGVKVVEHDVVCTPKSVSIDTPKLVVEALVPVKGAD